MYLIHVYIYIYIIYIYIRVFIANVFVRLCLKLVAHGIYIELYIVTVYRYQVP